MSRVTYWADNTRVYLHSKPVDFRKSINDINQIIEGAMGLTMMPDSQFVFVFLRPARHSLFTLGLLKFYIKPSLNIGTCKRTTPNTTDYEKIITNDFWAMKFPWYIPSRQ